MFKSIGFAFASVAEITGLTLGFFFLGSFIEERFWSKSKPWITVVLTFIGLSIGFYKLYKNYVRSNNQNE